ncbi:MAG: phosphatidylserine decarboxylase family protein [Sporomusaceae bacterium]|nr:phosphatidylserine decarboxylase family protein [Sporomusaceae bacterium]
MVKTPVVKEGYVYILAFLLLAVVAFFTLNIYWSILPAILSLYMMFFFRNPERILPTAENLILSPADGTVMAVSEIYTDEEFLHSEAIKVTIFLSVFNVHINRAPIAGEIKFQQYSQGRFRPAYKATVGWENERHTIGLENEKMRVLVTQIAGILARRIVSWVTLGNVLKQGERYGLIKFGSCTEIVVPKNVEILVKKGDKVKGGETIIGRVLNS